MENKIYSRKEAAKVFQVSMGTLRNWEKAGHIAPPSRIGRRVYFTDNQINRILGEIKL
jgi:predicted site-specific integrase-resolvase